MKESDQVTLGYTPLKKIEKDKVLTDIKSVQKRTAMSKKVEKYLDLFRELAKENDAELVFVLAPFADNAAGLQPYYNALWDYADRYGVSMLQGNYYIQEMGLEVRKDFGYGSHLTDSGAEKFTRFLWDKVLCNMQLADHRGDSRYQRWEDNKEFMLRNEGKKIEVVE